MQVPTYLQDGAHAELNELETKILILLSRNYSNVEIAQVLVTNAETIEGIVSRLLTKLGLTSRLAATVWMMKRRRHQGGTSAVFDQPWDGSHDD